jgi:hypothetical protein
MLIVWTERSGYSFGTFEEEQTIDIALPVVNDTGVSYHVISGALPSGLAIRGNRIKGIPYITANSANYEFCIRASRNNTIADRTFNIFIHSVNVPIFITPPGLLPVGPNNQLYITDQTYMEYQIQVSDLNLSVGKNLNFFIASGDGTLPPGLTLSESGLISGFIEPAPKISVADGTGNYDEVRYDDTIYDFAIRSTNGYDSYIYDDVVFDFNLPISLTQTLSLNYQFKVTVTDSINYAQRIFRIFVAGSDEFRADSTTYDGFADNFKADSTYVRKPQWLTKANLGFFRSNNYLTVPVALYDKNLTVFRLEPTNHETYAVAYQINYDDNLLGSRTVTIDNVTTPPKIGQGFTLDNYLLGASDTVYKILNIVPLSPTRYRLFLTSPLAITIPDTTAFYIGSDSTLPKGVKFDIETGDVYGMVPYQPAITEKYTFTITATRVGDNYLEIVGTSKTFNLTILGSINSVINWVSPSNLGTIPADYVCTLSVVATTNVADAVVTYTVVNGELPPGITLTTDGELIGIPNQYNNIQAKLKGLIEFDAGTTTFDAGTTTIDRIYTFTVEAADQYGYSANTKQFTVSISSPNAVIYNNITARPYMIPEQRALFKNFIRSNTIFPSSSVYRPNDPNFGIQTNLTMLVYAGIESTDAAALVGAMGLNMKPKRFQFGSIKKAIAVDPDTNQEVYEVVYIQMVDPLEPNGRHLPLSIKTQNDFSETISADYTKDFYSVSLDVLSADYPTAKRADIITVDSTGYEINTPNPNTYFPSSISNWQKRIGSIGDSERNYLPLWMRTIQPNGKQQLGYTLCVPLCFCKPGTADTILLNIKHNSFDFTQLDYTVDRYTITSAAGYNSDKYLVFKNNRITV